MTVTNDYYEFTPRFIPDTRVRSEEVNAQFDLLQAAFDLIAPEGNFNASLSGMTAGVNGTVLYNLSANQATLFGTANILGTSNAATMVMSGLPDAVVPGSVKIVPCTMLVDGGVSALLGFAQINTDNTITFYLATVNGSRIQAGAFASSGQKGLGANWSLTYDLG